MTYNTLLPLLKNSALSDYASSTDTLYNSQNSLMGANTANASGKARLRQHSHNSA